jgi:hypothetical protein
MKGLLIFTWVCIGVTIGYGQDIISNNTSLKSHKLFGAIEIGIPENVNRVEANKEIVEDAGFAYFSTADKKIDITVRKMSEADLSQVKNLMDNLSKSVYNGTIVRSEIVKINGIEFFVTDIKGQWNGAGDVIGMFRYYFNIKGESYNLLMKYPVDLVDKTKDLKEKLLHLIKIVQ